ncbi:hypothetical protein WDU94_006802, partial [Cyamophila willieti]
TNISNAFSLSIKFHCLNPSNTRSKLVLSSYTLLWCLIYLFILPIHFISPVSTHKFPNTLSIATSVIVLNLSCISLLILDWGQQPLWPFYSIVIRPILPSWSPFSLWFLFTPKRYQVTLLDSQLQPCARDCQTDCLACQDKDVTERNKQDVSQVDQSSRNIQDVSQVDQSSVRKRQLYQTMKCMMAMKKRIRRYRESKLAQIASSGDNVQIAPSEDNSQLDPSRENSQPAPYVENFQITPSKDNAQIAPFVENFQITPSKDNAELDPSVKNFQVTPCEDNAQLAPSEDNAQITPSPCSE